MDEQYNRLNILYSNNLKKIQDNTIMIVGLGGVGSFACEAIARFGIKRIIIIDKDVVDKTNLNRQLVALHSTIGQDKVEVMKQRILDINPYCEITCLKMFLLDDNINELFNKYKVDFVIDACDTITTKLLIIRYCLRNKIKFITSCGAANKLDASKVCLTSLDKTYNDGVAKILRNKIRKLKIKARIPVICSEELPMKIMTEQNTCVNNRKNLGILGSTSFVPPTFGMMCASYCIQELLKKYK